MREDAGGSPRPRLSREFLEWLSPKIDLWRHIAGLRRFSWLWPRAAVRKKINGVLCEFLFEPDPIGLWMYLGLYERATQRVLRHFLRPGDCFLDVGAHVGYLSALAAGLVGRAGLVLSFEPVPQYFARLERLAALNPGHHIVPLPFAAGDREGAAAIQTSRTNPSLNTMVPGLNSSRDVAETIAVRMVRLDQHLQRTGVERVALIKIDAEGYELPVLRGLQGYFEQRADRPPVIVEIWPRAYPLLGSSLRDLADCLRAYGYRAFRLDPRRRAEIDVTALRTLTTVLLLAGDPAEGGPSVRTRASAV